MARRLRLLLLVSLLWSMLTGLVTSAPARAESVCQEWSFAAGAGGWVGEYGTALDGAGWNDSPQYDGAYLFTIGLSSLDVVRVEVEFNENWTGNSPQVGVWPYYPADGYRWSSSYTGGPVVSIEVDVPEFQDLTALYVVADRWVGNTQHFGAMRLIAVRLYCQTPPTATVTRTATNTATPTPLVNSWFATRDPRPPCYSLSVTPKVFPTLPGGITRTPVLAAGLPTANLATRVPTATGTQGTPTLVPSPTLSPSRTVTPTGTGTPTATATMDCNPDALPVEVKAPVVDVGTLTKRPGPCATLFPRLDVSTPEVNFIVHIPAIELHVPDVQLCIEYMEFGVKVVGIDFWPIIQVFIGLAMVRLILVPFFREG